MPSRSTNKPAAKPATVKSAAKGIVSKPAPQVKTRKVKARALLHSTRLAIAKYKEKHPGAKFGDVAAKFSVTYDQAREAWLQYEEGKLVERRGRRLRAIKASGDPVAILRILVDKTLVALNQDRSLTAIELVQQLQSIAPVLRIAHQLSLSGHLRGFDAQIFAATVRRFRPGATDEDIVTMFHEIRALCLAELQS